MGNRLSRIAALIGIGTLLIGTVVPGVSARGFQRDVAYYASSYINPDLGMGTENRDVNDDSACDRPDRRDTQALSSPGTTNRNVHNDACLYGRYSFDQSVSTVDVPATFESSGVGVISACPDPDGAGPKTATLSNNGRRCTQTGYQSRGIPGDREYHVRLNNSTTAGEQRVVFCYDPGLDGCAGEQVRSVVTVTWVNTAARASSYINRDTGMATENPDVEQGSNCANPDRSDNQQLSTTGTTNRNVHNDACLFAGSRETVSTVDGPATFESTGVGVISACPDPDGAGPKTATLSGDGKRCHQTGYQEKGTPGDLEFHVRLNNSTTPGEQRVTFCSDPDTDGCADETVKQTITINWQAGSV
jgi:Zn ribbon nucleic-acid-binding protein